MKVLSLSLFLLGLQCLQNEGAKLVKVEVGGYDFLKAVAANSKKMVGLMTSLDNKMDQIIKKMGYSCHRDFRMDFENGINHWNKTGTAFNNQPTYGDNPKHRKRESAKQQGHWWIGGYENRPSPSYPAGGVQGDGPTGTLTSPVFRITGNTLSFLIGGGCDVAKVRVELLIGHLVVKRETGRCSETMQRRYWDVHGFHGKVAQIRLVDQGTGGWGHINFDDLRGYSCL